MMTKDDHIRYWLEASKHDLETAKSMFRSRHFDWSLFVAHLALEKILKAMWVKNNTSNAPPRTHNLIRLAEGAHLDITEEQKVFLGEVTEFNIETRYTEAKRDFYKLCTEEFADSYLRRINEVYEWIESNLSKA